MRFAPGGLIFVGINEKLSSLRQYTSVGPEADGKVTDLSQKVKGGRNAEGAAPCGMSKIEAIVSEVKRK